MSPPTNAEIIHDHTNDDLGMEGESSEAEGDHAPPQKTHWIPETSICMT
jgi:hypothetical protein